MGQITVTLSSLEIAVDWNAGRILGFMAAKGDPVWEMIASPVIHSMKTWL